MGRSIKKGPFVQEKLLARIIKMNEANEKRVLKTWSRSSTIFPEMGKSASEEKERFDNLAFLFALRSICNSFFNSELCFTEMELLDRIQYWLIGRMW